MVSEVFIPLFEMGRHFGEGRISLIHVIGPWNSENKDYYPFFSPYLSFHPGIMEEQVEKGPVQNGV